jgi:predicted Ser/Thr protein kinase
MDEAITIKPEDLKIKEVIGRGGFSIVYRGTWRKTPVAIKRFTQTNNEDDDDPFDTYELLQEARIMLYVNSGVVNVTI